MVGLLAGMALAGLLAGVVGDGYSSLLAGMIGITY